jgi:hypothetical protein
MEVSGQFHVLAALPPGEIAPGTHWIGGWVGPRADWDATENRKHCPCRKSNPAIQPVAIATSNDLSRLREIHGR